MARTNAFEKLKERSFYYIRIIIFLLGETPRVNKAQTDACKMTGAVSERVALTWKPLPGLDSKPQRLAPRYPVIPESAFLRNVLH